MVKPLPYVHISQGIDPLPPSSLHKATAGKNYLNEEITPLLPTGIVFSDIAIPYQIYDMQRSCADVNSPL
jgi:hypothetical protein